MYAVITALLLAVGLPLTAAAAPKPDDCRRVAKADWSLCQRVKGQFPYTYATDGGLNQIVEGRVLVREITHQGLTKREMHSYLTGEAAAYRRYATGSRSIVVNLDSLRKHYGPSAHYEVHVQGKDAAVSIVQP